MLLLHCLSTKGWVELSIKALLHLVTMTGLSSWASTAFTISLHWHTTLWQLVLPLKGLSRHDPSMPQSSSPLPPSNCGTTEKKQYVVGASVTTGQVHDGVKSQCLQIPNPNSQDTKIRCSILYWATVQVTISVTGKKIKGYLCDSWLELYNL